MHVNYKKNGGNKLNFDNFFWKNELKFILENMFYNTFSRITI